MKKTMVIVALFIGLIGAIYGGYCAVCEYENYRYEYVERNWMWTSPETLTRYIGLTKHEYKTILDLWEGGMETEEILDVADVDWDKVEVDTRTWSVTTWDDVTTTW